MFDIVIKKEELVNEACKAFDNYAFNRYDESAVQARKSGENIARIILAKQGKGKLPLNERSGFKDLIAAVKTQTQVSKKTVNLLETLQLVGNKASHGNITAADAAYVINALRLLCQAVFEEVLQEKIPPRLLKYLDQKSDKENLEEEIRQLKNKLKQDKKTKEETGEKTPVNPGPDADILKKIEELEQKIERQEQAGREVEKQVVAAEEEKNITADEKHLPAKKNKKKWFILPAMIAMVAGLCVVFLPGKKSSKETVPVKHEVKKNTALTIGLFDFQVLEDNKLVKLELEKDLLKYISQIAKDNNWEIKIRHFQKNNLSSDVEQAKEKCLAEKIDLAIGGEVFENRKGDSSTVLLRYMYNHPQFDEPFFGELDRIKIDLGSLSGMQLLKKETALLMNFGLGFMAYFDSEYNKAYELTKDLYSPSAYLMENILHFNFMCQSEAGNFKGAEKAAKVYIRAFPDSAKGHEFYAQALDYQLPETNRQMDSTLKAMEKKYPASAAFWYLRAKYTQHMKKNTTLAIGYAEKALKINPAYYEANLIYAGLLLDKNEVEKSKSIAQEALKIASYRFEAYYIMSKIYAYEKKYPAAISWLRRGLTHTREGTPAAAQLYDELGINYFMLYERDKRFADSIHYYFDKAIASGSPDAALIYANKAGLYFRQQDTLKAIATMKKSVETDPQYVYGYESLAMYYSLLGQYDEMKKYAEKALALDPGNLYAVSSLANYYVKINPSKSTSRMASSYASRYARITSGDADALTVQAWHQLYNLNNADSARYFYEKMLARDTKSVDALYGLAEVYSFKKEYKKALEYYKKRAALPPATMRAFVAVSQAYMLLPYSQANVTAAYDYAKEALAMDPNSGVAYFNMAQVYLFGNNTAEAKRHYDKAVSLSPSLQNSAFEKSMDEVYQKLQNAK